MVWSHLNTCFLDVCSYIRTRPHTTRMCCCSFGMSDKIRHAYFRCDIMDNQTFVPFINLCLRWQILWWKWYTLSWCCLTLVATAYDSFFSKFSLNSLISLSLSPHVVLQFILYHINFIMGIGQYFRDMWHTCWKNQLTIVEVVMLPTMVHNWAVNKI